jgi:import receptor subunit TOM70
MTSEISGYSFLKANWKFILAAVVATGVTAGVIYSFQSTPSSPRKKSKKKKRSSKTVDETKSGATTPEDTVVLPNEAKEVAQEAVVDKNALALEQKTAGNEFYAAKQYKEAIEKYTNAIDILPSAVYYCNRAACYSNLGNHQLTIDDCTKAIEMDPKYIKAFHRRALAYEQLGNNRSALNEYTVVCALENFQNQSSMAAPDRILKVIASERATELLASKNETMPSETFITAYLDSFRSTPTDSTIIKELEASESDESLKVLKQAFEFVAKHEWQKSLELVSSAIELNTFVETSVKAKALNYRGTMYFLMGKIAEAVNDLELSLELDPENINTIIKRATLYMESGDVEKTIEQFKRAEALTPNHPDLFYHRGQVRFLTGDFNGACEDYERSIEFEKPEESTVYVHIQLGVAKYKLGDMVGAEKKFRDAKEAFPNSAEVWNYHGEILLDKQDYRQGFYY